MNRLMAKAKIAVIGCGYWGKNLVRNMAELGALAAVVDSNEQTAIFMAKTYNVVARSFEEVLADKEINYGTYLPEIKLTFYSLRLYIFLYPRLCINKGFY